MLGRVYIYLEVSIMSSHLALPRECHIDQAYHIFSCLKNFHNTEMAFDPSDLIVQKRMFERQCWASSKFGNLIKDR